MRRAISLLAMFALASSLAPTVRADESPPKIWSNTLALGPQNAPSIAARDGLLIAGGRPQPKQYNIPGPRHAGIFVSTDHGASWTLGKTVGDDSQVIDRTPDIVGLPDSGTDA